LEVVRLAPAREPAKQLKEAHESKPDAANIRKEEDVAVPENDALLAVREIHDAFSLGDPRVAFLVLRDEEISGSIAPKNEWHELNRRGAHLGVRKPVAAYVF
jgi:hypothetical protein